jgi:integrase
LAIIDIFITFGSILIAPIPSRNPTTKKYQSGAEFHSFFYGVMKHLASQNSAMVYSAATRSRHVRAFQKEKAPMPEHMRPRGKNGIFYADFWMDGVHYQDSLGTSDRRWAERILANLKDKIEGGEYYKHKTVFQDLIPKYIEKLSERSVHLQLRNKVILEKHLIPYFGSQRLADVNKASVIQYKLDREKERTTESTLKKELRVFKEVMLLVDPNWKNPTVADSDLMKFVYKGKRITNFLEEEDVYRVVECMPGKYQKLCLVAAYSGLRLKNVVELMWSCIDLANGWIQVNQSKTGDLVRVPISRKLKDVLLSIKVRPLEENKRVFPEARSKPITTAFKRASAKAGFGWASFHSLRHFCGSYLANHGIRQELIAEVLGHKDLRSTQVYTHFRPDTVKEAVSVFDREEDICKLSASEKNRKGSAL